MIITFFDIWTVWDGRKKIYYAEVDWDGRHLSFVLDTLNQVWRIVKPME